VAEPRHIRELRTLLPRKYGITVTGFERTRGNHGRLLFQQGPVKAWMVVAMTPSDHRGTLNSATLAKRRIDEERKKFVEQYGEAALAPPPKPTPAPKPAPEPVHEEVPVMSPTTKPRQQRNMEFGALVKDAYVGDKFTITRPPHQSLRNFRKTFDSKRSHMKRRNGIDTKVEHYGDEARITVLAHPNGKRPNEQTQAAIAASYTDQVTPAQSVDTLTNQGDETQSFLEQRFWDDIFSRTVSALPGIPLHDAADTADLALKLRRARFPG
jgi:hypothetical protein